MNLESYQNPINMLSLKNTAEVLKHHLFEEWEEKENRWSKDVKGFCQAEHEGEEESGWKVKRGASRGGDRKKASPLKIF